LIKRFPNYSPGGNAGAKTKKQQGVKMLNSYQKKIKKMIDDRKIKQVKDVLSEIPAETMQIVLQNMKAGTDEQTESKTHYQAKTKKQQIMRHRFFELVDEHQLKYKSSKIDAIRFVTANYPEVHSDLIRISNPHLYK
jgi:Mg/Co/Ni transporter MgtE